MKECKPGARRHEHLDDGLMKVFGEGWEVTISDDGSVCDAVTEYTPPKYTPEQVLATIMIERTDMEADIRRNRNKAQRKGK